MPFKSGLTTDRVLTVTTVSTVAVCGIIGPVNAKVMIDIIDAISSFTDSVRIFMAASLQNGGIANQVQQRHILITYLHFHKVKKARSVGTGLGCFMEVWIWCVRRTLHDLVAQGTRFRLDVIAFSVSDVSNPAANLLTRRFL
jgi:hypothetical protein